MTRPGSRVIVRSSPTVSACASRIANSLAESGIEATSRGARRSTYADPHMRDLLLALLHLAVVTAKLCGSGGVRAVMTENLLLRQQLIVFRRARQRAPNAERPAQESAECPCSHHERGSPRGMKMGLVVCNDSAHNILRNARHFLSR